MMTSIFFIFTCVSFLVNSSAADNVKEKVSVEKLEPVEEVNTLSMNKQEQQSDASKTEGVTGLSGAKRVNSKKLPNDVNSNFSEDAKGKTTENGQLSTSTAPSMLDLFDKYLEKYGAEMKKNNGLTFEDLVKHLEKDELMLMTKAYEVLASGHENLVKKLREHALTTTTTTTTTTTLMPPVYQSRSLRYRPKYKKLSHKQEVKQDPTLFFINNGRIYSIKRHS